MEEGQKNAQIAKRNAEATAEYHFSLAQAYVAEGNPDRAIEEFKLTLLFDPKSSLVYARLANEYIKKGMTSAAMEACKEALQRDPKFTDARLILAGLYSNSRDYDAALAEYDRILKDNPKLDEAAIYKSQILLEEGRPADAAALLKQQAKRSPESPLIPYYLGRAQARLDQFKEAVASFRKAMDLRPGFVQAALALGYLYEEKGMNAEAIRVYQETFDGTQDLALANRLATIYLKQEKYKEAIPYLEAIQASDSEDLNSRVKLGLIYMELKQYSKAVALFTWILDKSPESDRVLYYLGSIFEETKQWDSAIANLKKIPSSSKLYPDAVLHVGYLLKQKGQMDDARSFIKESISKSPATPSFYLFQASLEEDSKNLPEATRILEGAVSKFFEDEKMRYYLGSLYDKQGEIEKGLEQMEAILKINPDNVDALNYIGYTWTQKGIRLDDAERLLRRALTLRPGNGYIQDSWGWYLFVRGRVGEAVVELEKAVKLRPNEPAILEHLGDAYLRSNLREKALLRYQDAARYAEDEPSKRKVEAKAQTLRQELAGQQRSTQTSERAPASVRESATSK